MTATITCPCCGAKVGGGTSCTTCGSNPGRATRKWGTPPTKEQDAPGASGLVPQLIWDSKIGKRQPKAKAKTAPLDRHYLVPPFGQWFQLERTSAAMVLGRDEQCDLRIDSPTVSRRHAELELKGKPPRIYLKDLGTINGTSVNGERVESERLLEDRDVVRLGEITAVYRFVPHGTKEVAAPEPEPSLEALNATIPMGAPGKKAIQGLTGDVALYPMSELLGRLTMLRASGSFVVEVDGVTGKAVFVDGDIKHASFLGRTGSGAIQSIAELRRGRFRFQPPMS